MQQSYWVRTFSATILVLLGLGADSVRSEDGTGNATPVLYGFHLGIANFAREMIHGVYDSWLCPTTAAISIIVMVLIGIGVMQSKARTKPLPSKAKRDPIIKAAWIIVPVAILLVIAIPSFRLLTRQLELRHVDITTKPPGGVIGPNAARIPTSSPSFHFSPANWKGDTGRGGSAYRQTFYAGAYFDFVFTAGSSPAASLLLGSNADSLPISYFVNGVLQDNVATASMTSVSLTGLVPSAVNTVRAYVRSSPSTSRWGGTNTLQIQGMVLDAGSTAGTASAASKWILFGGDSINEGWVVDAGASNFLHSASFQVVETFRTQGYDIGMMAATGSGFLAVGNGSVPALYSVSGGEYSDSASRWNKVDSGLPLIDSAGQISAFGATGTTPAAIVWNFGTNDANQSVNQTDLRTSVKGAFGAFATAAPGAKIILVPGIPLDVGNVGGAATSAAYLSAITNGFSDAVASNPTASLTLTDFGSSFGQNIYGYAANRTDAFHPSALGNAYIAPRFVGLLTAALASDTVAPRLANHGP